MAPQILTRLGSSLLLPLLLLGSTANAAPSTLSTALAARADDYHWVDTWTSMPQLVEQRNMPPSAFVR